jgi:anion-transporting  ArsA/GET3 family ATPase
MLPDRLTIVVGAGGVGKTTIAAALGVGAAHAGRNALVMTFDPSLRLKDALGVDDAARGLEVEVPVDAPGSLSAGLLDARSTFDRLVYRYAPDQESRDRILGNRFYTHLAGSLAGVLEYMAVERLFEAAADPRYDTVVLDTPPTRQALDFLAAPERILGFLSSGALKIALKPWFDKDGHLRPTARLGRLGRSAEAFLDHLVGLDLLRDMAEFFQAFGPLYEGFRQRAQQVQDLLRAPGTGFVLVSGTEPLRAPDTMFFARRLEEAGHHLRQVVVNRVHPRGTDVQQVDHPYDDRDGRSLLAWLGRRDHRVAAELRSLLGGGMPLIEVPLLAEEPTELSSLERVARHLFGSRKKDDAG